MDCKIVVSLAINCVLELFGDCMCLLGCRDCKYCKGITTFFLFAIPEI